MALSGTDPHSAPHSCSGFPLLGAVDPVLHGGHIFIRWVTELVQDPAALALHPGHWPSGLLREG